MSQRPMQRPAITLTKLSEKKALGEPIAMVTAYDYPSAQVAEEAGVDVVLVGDSGAMTVLGYPSTLPVTLDELLMLAAAVRRGLSTPLLVGDMPFGSYEASNELAVQNAQRFVKEAGVDAVKLERGGSTIERTRAIVGAGIPVMGHVGLTPQNATALGGYRSQGRTAERAFEVMHDAVGLQEAGAFSIVFEAIPSPLTEVIMPRMRIPVIGIGAGPATDGQVLVYHDLLGIYYRPPRAVRQAIRERPRADDQGRQGVRGRRASAPLPRARSRVHHGAGRARAAARDGRRGHGRAVHGRLLPLTRVKVHTGQLRFSTEGDGDVIDLTDGVRSVLESSGVVNGVVSVFVPGSTAAVTAMEHEPGGVTDLRATLERLIPAQGDYEHNRLNNDTNSHAHIRAAIVGPSETVPVRDGRLDLGTWQQLVLVDFDDRPRQRTVVVQVIG